MTTTEKPSEPRLLGFNISKQPLIAYFILTYAITWLFTIPFVYCFRVVFEQSFNPWLLVFIPGAYGPTIAALIMTYKLEGKSGLKRLANKLLIWRVHWKWYLFVLLLPLVWVCIAIVFDYGSNVFSSFSSSLFPSAFLMYFLVALPFGPLAEELGWRGYALPRLQTKYSPLVSSIIIGIIWTFWHSPMFWFPGAAIPSFLELSLYSVFLYLIQMIALSILFTYLFNYTLGSVLMAILFHTVYNASENIIFDCLDSSAYYPRHDVYIWTIALMWLLAILSIYFKSNKVVKQI